VHALNHPVIMGMVSCSEHELDAQARAGRRPQSRSELGPLSVLTVANTPKRATHLAMKASAHVLASMLRKGTASNHLVDLSMMVSR